MSVPHETEELTRSDIAVLATWCIALFGIGFMCGIIIGPWLLVVLA